MRAARNILKLVVVSLSSAPNSHSDWLWGFNEFKMAAGVVIRIQDGVPLVPFPYDVIP